MAMAPSNQWGVGICGGDCGDCIFAMCLPPCATASTRTSYDSSNWCFNCMCLSTGMMRNIIREGYGIEGGCCSDMILSYCLLPCVVAQAKKEVLTRGPRAAKPGVAEEQWKTGLFGCGEDIVGFILALCFPPCIFALARTEFDTSSVVFNVCCAGGPLISNIIREGYHIEGGCFMDILCGQYCAPCRAAQLRREVKARGPIAQQAHQGALSSGRPSGH